MAEHDDGPVTWVAPGDSDEENDCADPSTVATQQLDALDDPLLGHVDRSSNEGKRLMAARKQFGAAVDMRYESFDPLLYLSTVHQPTPLSQVRVSAEICMVVVCVCVFARVHVCVCVYVCLCVCVLVYLRV